MDLGRKEWTRSRGTNLCTLTSCMIWRMGTLSPTGRRNTSSISSASTLATFWDLFPAPREGLHFGRLSPIPSSGGISARFLTLPPPVCSSEAGANLTCSWAPKAEPLGWLLEKDTGTCFSEERREANRSTVCWLSPRKRKPGSSLLPRTICWESGPTPSRKGWESVWSNSSKIRNPAEWDRTTDPSNLFAFSTTKNWPFWVQPGAGRSWSWK